MKARWVKDRNPEKEKRYATMVSINGGEPLLCVRQWNGLCWINTSDCETVVCWLEGLE
jgi:hypothetical protein